MTKHTQVLIIGGGMMGVGLAYHLAEAGWRPLLLEKGELTSGSTWHAAGQTPGVAGDFNMMKIHFYGQQLYGRLAAETGQHTGWHNCGGLRLALRQEEVDWFHQMASYADAIGCRAEVIGPEEIKAYNPFLNLEGVLAAILTLDDGHVDPSACCQALAKGARMLGAEIQRHTRVTGIRQLPNDEWEVQTPEETFIAEHLVNAAGCYANAVMQWLGLTAPITNMNHQYVVTEAIPAFADLERELPVMRDPYVSGYFRQEQQGGLIGIYEDKPSASWESQNNTPDWNADSELFEPNLDPILGNLERCFERMPIFKEAGIKRIVHGGISHTPDSSPLVGPAGGLRNFWMCCGSSIGIAQGAGCGKYLAQQMVHGDADINMAAYDPRRFDESWAGPDYVRAKSFEDYARMYNPLHPGDEFEAGRMRRTSALYETLKDRGCQFTTGFGWERPKWFSVTGRPETPSWRRNESFQAVAEECKAVRERVGIQDLSSFAKFAVTGPDAAKVLSRVYANRLPGRDGRIILAHSLGPSGRVRGEVTITRMSPTGYALVGGASWETREYDQIHQAVAPDEEVTIHNMTQNYGVLVVAGPQAQAVLSSLTETPLDSAHFRWLTARSLKLAGIEVFALRVNYVGSSGWELQCRMADLKTLYGKIWEAGQAYDIRNYGLYAMNALRLEKAYKGLGADITNEVTPVEADLMRFVDKAGSFTGKAFVEKALERSLGFRIVYASLEAVDSDVAGGEACYLNGKRIGLTTSGGYGHHTGLSLFFAYLDEDVLQPGLAFDVGILGTRRRAHVLPGPVYDPSNEKLRA